MELVKRPLFSITALFNAIKAGDCWSMIHRFDTIGAEAQGLIKKFNQVLEGLVFFF